MEFILVLLIIACIFGFLLSYALGANDVGNSLGTAVGAKVLTVKQACVVGSIFEVLGTLYLGKYVFLTLRTGVVKPECFADENNWDSLALGFFGASVASFVWMSFATWKGLPVSSAHSIVGGVFGFGAAFGYGCVNISKMLMVAGSWIASPVLGAIGGYAFYYACEAFILRKPYPLRSCLKLIPYFWGFTVTVFAVFMVMEGLGEVGVHPTMTEWVYICIGFFVVTYLAVRVFYVPRKRKTLRDLEERLNKVSPGELNLDKQAEPRPAATEATLKPIEMKEITVASNPPVEPSSPTPDNQPESGRALVPEPAKAPDSRVAVIKEMSHESEKMFIPLLLFSAAVLMFAHGANNVANCVGPLDAIYLIYTEGHLSSDQGWTPMWIIAMGGVGMVVGLATAGYLVMQTIGQNITTITISRGFSAQLSSAVVILLANLLGIPVSSTHVTIGAVTGVGLVISYRNINLSMLKKILYSWIYTFPSVIIVSIVTYLLLDRYAM